MAAPQSEQAFPRPACACTLCFPGSPVCSLPLTTYLLEDRVGGCVQMVAVEQQALVHPHNPATLPEVLVEEKQVLRHALHKEGSCCGVSPAPQSVRASTAD